MIGIENFSNFLARNNVKLSDTFEKQTLLRKVNFYKMLKEIEDFIIGRSVDTTSILVQQSNI